MHDLEQSIQELAAKAERDAADQKIETIVRILSALYDRAATYTNLILVAGFAAFFAVWSNMKGTMSRSEMLWAALAVSFSLIVFITWEITTMIIRAHALRGLSKALNVPPEELDASLAAQQRFEERLNVRIYQFWYGVLVLTIVPGLAGGGVLFFSFFRQLLNGPQ